MTTKFDDKTTRIDLETQGDHVLIEYFDAGWVQGETPATITTFAVDTPIFKLLEEYEQAGFTVWMADALHGRALRGVITRIDFVCLNGQMHVRKYPYGWTARTPAISDKIMPECETQEAIQWCKSNRWTVYEWPGGARAWRGPIMPVRDAKDIRNLRREINNNRQAGIPDERIHFNLAFYF